MAVSTNRKSRQSLDMQIHKKSTQFDPSQYISNKNTTSIRKVAHIKRSHNFLMKLLNHNDKKPPKIHGEFEPISVFKFSRVKPFD